ncbi:MAG: hypothetical protein K0R12_593, partial [Gammaproteobacteria bacterium]|nr:hypothetical protein [Gammaproteobacteria bacterium]
GLGVKLGIDQLLTDQVKFSVDSTLSQAENEVTGEVGVLVPSARGTRMEVAYYTDYIHSQTTANNFFSNGLKLAFSWDEDPRQGAPRYEDFGPINKQTLSQWTSDPAVRMSEVLAVADQTNLVGDFPVSRFGLLDTCPAPEDVDLSGSSSLKTSATATDKATNTQWTSASGYLSKTSSEHPDLFIRAAISQVGAANYAQVTCTYKDELGVQFDLLDADIRPASVVVNGDAPLSSSTPKQRDIRSLFGAQRGKARDDQTQNWGYWHSDGSTASCNGNPESDTGDYHKCEFYVTTGDYDYSDIGRNWWSYSQYCYAAHPGDPDAQQDCIQSYENGSNGSANHNVATARSKAYAIANRENAQRLQQRLNNT